MDAATRPIGYWLKHLDNLIEAQFAAVLDDAGIERRHWQALSVLARGPEPRAAITAALAPFRSDSQPGLGPVLDDLAARGWIAPGDDGALALTAAGRAARAAVAGRVQDTRDVILAGLTADQYAETIRILSVMAANVEAALARELSPVRSARSG